MFDRADMFDVQGRQRRIILMRLAIFATIASSSPNHGPRGSIHAALPALNFFASRRKTAANLFART